jgi:hypothetical protein
MPVRPVIACADEWNGHTKCIRREPPHRCSPEVRSGSVGTSRAALAARSKGDDMIASHTHDAGRVAPAQPKLHPARPFTIRTGSVLTEDVVGTADLHLPDDPFAVALYRNPFKGDRVEVAIARDDKLWLLVRDPSSPGGWRMTDKPDGENTYTDCKNVVSVHMQNGTVWIIAAGDYHRYFFTVAADGLVYAGGGKGSLISYPRVTYQQSIQRPIIYGVGEQGSLVTLNPDGDWWSGVIPIGVQDWWSTDDFRACVVGTHTTIGINYQGEFQWYEIPSSTGTVSGPHTVPGLPRIKRILCEMPSYTGDAAFLVLAADGTIYYIAEGSPWLVRPVGDLQVADAVGVLDTRLLMHVYIAHKDGHLSVLHQTGWTPIDGWRPGPPAWAEGRAGQTKVVAPIPLATGISRVLVDTSAIDAPTLLALGTQTTNGGKAARLLEQDATSGHWLSRAVRTASASFRKTTRWRTEIALVDANQMPVPDYSLNVAARSSCEVEAGGQFFVVDELNAISLRTDRTGRLTFASEATGLNAPPLIVSVDALRTDHELKADHAVQSYLAGAGALPGKAAFDGATLQQAKVDGQLLVPADVWTSNFTPNDAVAAIHQLTAIADSNLSPSNAGFIVQMFDSTRPRQQFYASRAELEAAHADLCSRTEYGGIFDAVGHFLGDVVEGIKSSALKVASLKLDVLKKEVEVLAWIGNKVVSLGTFVVRTSHDAFDAVISYFSAIKVQAVRLLEWLRAVFGFKDIWETKSAIEGALSEMPAALRDQVKKKGSLIDSALFDSLKMQVSSSIARVKAEYAKRSMQDLGWNGAAVSAKPISVGPTYGTLPVDPSTTRYDPQGNWLFDKLNTHLSNMSEGTLLTVLSSLPAASGPLDELIAAFEKLEGSFTAIAQTLWQWAQASFGNGSLGAAMRTVPVADLLTELEQAAVACIDLLKGLWHVLLQALGATLDAVEALLKSNFNLGPLNQLYQWVQELAGVQQKQPLTVAGFISLLAAFPATVAFKAANGVDARLFPGGHILPSTADTGSPTPAQKRTAGTACIWVGAITAGLVYPSVDVLNDLIEEPKLANQIASIVDVGMSAVATLFSWPSSYGITLYEWDYFDPASWGGNDGKKRWPVVLNWAVSWLYAPAELYCLKNNVTARTENYGKLWYVAIGLLQFGTGILESAVAEENAGQWLSNLTGPIPAVFQVLRLEPVLVSSWGSAALGLKSIINLVFGTANGLTKLAWLYALPPASQHATLARSTASELVPVVV